MKSIKQIFCLTLLTVFVMTGSLRAEKVKGVVRSSSSPKAESATCLPASSSNELTVNNVRAYIETGGTMWFKEVAEYEVPRGSGKTSMFCAALWIGGKDSNGQLKLAAVRFRQVGDDYWTGPLKITGASTTQSMCIKFDKHFKITRAEVDQHINSYNTSGYVMPASIANWPAHGDEGYSYYLAPFKDVNDNGVYDPENGDYPYYDINNDLCPWTEDNIARAANHTLPRTPEDLLYYGPDWQNSNGMIYADHVLKGDETLFWIFNDNAGAHTESQGQPIGLEIRGQAFGFATNDELNNMTFYSYEIINRSTYTLTNTYFSQWVDPDLGYANDDYVGCDVARGLGYCYNGSNVDGSGQNWAYGDQPPAVGVDFFQGPYMDPDGRDNPKFYPDSASEIGYCNKFLRSAYEADQMAINGVNFGDSIVDNERFGMRRFVYHNNNSSVTGDPSVAFEYYNMLQGIWKDNSKMKYGGNAHSSNGGVGPECDFMFPALTDVCNWGVKDDQGLPGFDPNPSQYGADGWTEANVGNAPYDRRFMQSAGPFTLKPGSVNYITVGIPWARAAQGGAQASVELLKRADDKCQSLFENCFKTLDGPDAPDVTIRELENELILYISNNNPNSNNYHETYTEMDPQIPKTLETSKLVEVVDSIPTHTETGADTTIAVTTYKTVTEIDTLSHEQRSYIFEGYQIYQLANASVSVTDLDDANKALLIAQCDIQNGVGQLINWIYNDALGTSVATEMVNGTDNGIAHSFRITEDKFATGTNKKLVNHKEYYFLVLAYGYNEYKTFTLNADNLDGQQTTYLAGRRNIKTTVGIPHKPVETLQNCKYGDVPMITRIEGQGNGGLFLDMTDECRDLVLENNVYNDIQYKNNYGPLNIQVIDPLKVKPYDYTIKFLPNNISDDVNDSTMWQLSISDEVSDRELIDNGLFTLDGADTVPTRTTVAAMPISMTNEQLFLDLGISVSIKNANFKIYQQNLDQAVRDGKGYTYANITHFAQPDALGSTITFSDGIPWLTGLVDQEGDYPSNWIRAGQQTASSKWECNTVQPDQAECDYMKWRAEDFFNLFKVSTGNGSEEQVRGFMDPDQQFEKLVGGTWAPYVLSSPYDGGPKAKFLVKDITESISAPSPEEFNFQALDVGVPNKASYNQTMTNLYSVDIVLTPDKSKWTRAIVLESGSADLDANYQITQEFNGNTYHNVRMEPKTCPSVDKEGNPDNSGTTGLGWFPGYAINVETGERLNIMFAENSEDTLNNGNDMIFNPTAVYAYYRDIEADTLLRDEDGNFVPMSEGVYNSYRDNYGVRLGEPLNGGRHYVYVMGSSGNTANNYYQSSTRKRNFNDGGLITTVSSYPHGGTIANGMPYYECGPYDNAAWLKAKFATLTETNYSARSRMAKKMQIFNNVMWTSIPMPVSSQADNWLASDATIKLRVSRPYMRYSSRWYDDPSQSANASQNDGYPMYEFTTKNIAPTKVERIEDVETLLEEINIVPNPYYGYSNYEHTALENYVRIVNLPANCKISIYTVNGTLIRTLTHGSDATSFVEWDLKNHANIPIASGVYIIHVNAPGIGERTLKFFCNMRPTDLNGF
jgi:hypothetical protein